MPDKILSKPSSSRMERTPETTGKEEDSGEDNIVGLISDTHGVVEEVAILALRQATNIIIHAGDVGEERYKRRLTAQQLIAKLGKGTGKEIVPVAGNYYQGCTQLPTTQTSNIFGKKIVVIHICGFPPENTAEAEELIKSEAPDIVVFGLSHVPGVHKHDQRIFINRPRRFKLPRCIALLSVHKSGNVLVESISVNNFPRDVRALPLIYKDPVSSFQVHDSKSTCVREGPHGHNSLHVQNKKRRKFK